MQINTEQIQNLVRKTKPMFFNRNDAGHIQSKGRSDFVTQADFAVQQFMERSLKDLYPKIQFMGEEKDNSSIDFTGDVWILDPVDGTANLVHDLKSSTLSLALWEKGEITFGIVYHPYLDEVFWAEKGKGAYLNNERIHVSPAARMEDAIIAIGSSPYHHEWAEENFEMFGQIFKACEDVRRFGSAALELSYVAAGRLDAFIERTLKPWDYAAGMLLVKEAGGSVTDYNGSPLAGNLPSSLVCGTKELTKTLVRDYVPASMKETKTV